MLFLNLKMLLNVLYSISILTVATVVPINSDSDVILFLQLLSKINVCSIT